MTNEQILKKAKENPEHILCFFTKDNFKIVKAFWGKEEVVIWYNKQNNAFGECEDSLLHKGKKLGIDHSHLVIKERLPMFKYHLQQIVLEKDPLKYLEKFL